MAYAATELFGWEGTAYRVSTPEGMLYGVRHSDGVWHLHTLLWRYTGSESDGDIGGYPDKGAAFDGVQEALQALRGGTQ